MSESNGPSGNKRVLITGGAGFIGANLADRLLRDGHSVLLFDNLSRPGVELNLEWLRSRYGERVQFRQGDVRDAEKVAACVRDARAVFHFAAQVAVTTSLVDPALDFTVNAQGTLNVLEAVRKCGSYTPVFYTSTNKVYGDLEDIALRSTESRYVPADSELLVRGVSEQRRLSFHSPYGCSKGTADQYMLDYARSFGISSVVFRMSCIYGPRQFGTEDQGWVAHFLIRALERQKLVLYGDGRQVRDILFVEDLVRAFLLAWENVDRLSGQAFNIGGGPHHTTSLLELLHSIRELTGRKPAVGYESWRTGDQRYYVSDIRKFEAATGWRPEVGVREGVSRLCGWLTEQRDHITAEALAS